MRFNKYAYKNDTAELIELCQFIRDMYPKLNVIREGFVFFNKEDGHYTGYSKNRSGYNLTKFRNPDVMVFDSEMNLLFCYEVDGSIHDEMFDDNNRDKDYRTAGIPLLVTNKLLMETTIINDAYPKIESFMENI